jgi:hypothetical protein
VFNIEPIGAHAREGEGQVPTDMGHLPIQFWLRVKRKAERMPFTVAARNSEEAIQRAIKEYDVPERERCRISMQREA